MSRNFREYSVWQKARELNKEIYSIPLPPTERWGLADQMHRASVSISSNIAEGCGRNSSVEFARFLEIALGSAFETESQLILCNDLNYIDEKTLTKFCSKLHDIQRQLSALIRSAKGQN